MKAALALVIIYVGIFLVVVQGASRAPVQAAAQDLAPIQASVDPIKDTDIRSLMELVGAKDAIADATGKVADQYRESLLASLPDNESGHSFVNAFSGRYHAKFNPEGLTEQLVNIYDRHFTADEIRSLLQFYGSPAGQKFAAEMPKMNAEIQAATRNRSMVAAREVLQDLRKDFPAISAQVRLIKPHSAQQNGQQSGFQPTLRDAQSVPDLQPARQMQSRP